MNVQRRFPVYHQWKTFHVTLNLYNIPTIVLSAPTLSIIHKSTLEIPQNYHLLMTRASLEDYFNSLCRLSFWHPSYTIQTPASND